VLIPSSNVNTTPELRIFILTGFLRFFRRFPQINVGGDSTHLSSFGKRTCGPRLARPQKGTLQHFPNLLEAQGLSKLVHMNGNFYLKLVKVFYTCARADLEGNMFSIVNAGVMKAVAGLDMGGVCKFEESTDGYNKMQTYKGMLLDPTRNRRNHLGVGGLTAEDKMVVYLITYILTPRSSNHAQVTDDDLQIVYDLK